MISLDLLRNSHACALPLPSPSPFVSFQAVPLLPLSLRANKKSPVPDLGQDFHPAVPPKLTLSRPLAPRTNQACRPDNGCGPRQKLLVSFRPALASPFIGTSAAAISPLKATFCRLLLSLIGFLMMHYTHPGNKCQYPFHFFRYHTKFFPS